MSLFHWITRSVSVMWSTIPVPYFTFTCQLWILSWLPNNAAAGSSADQTGDHPVYNAQLLNAKQAKFVLNLTLLQTGNSSLIIYVRPYFEKLWTLIWTPLKPMGAESSNRFWPFSGWISKRLSNKWNRCWGLHSWTWTNKKQIQKITV